jgi:hypothetical protein
MPKQGREEWLQDVSESQRNIVFPDTVRNGGRFWRNLAHSKQRLTIGQIFGLGLMLLPCLGVVCGGVYWKLKNSTEGSILERLMPDFGAWITVLALFGATFMVLRWRVRQALLAAKNGNPSEKH